MDYNYMEIRKLAAGWAREAGNRILEIINSSELDAAYKSSNAADIVTKADTASEDYLREQIIHYFPHHAICGEERSAHQRKSSYTWLLDPVDGTLSMTLGTERFGVSVGLWKNNNPVVGVIYFPKLGRLVESAEGQGTFIDGRRVILQSVQRIPDDQPVVAFDYSAKEARRKQIENYLVPLTTSTDEYASYAGYTMMYCSVVYTVLQLLEGKIHAYIHPGPTIYDMGAALLAIKEAGGKTITVEKAQKINIKENILPAIIMAWSAELAERLRTRLNQKGAP